MFNPIKSTLLITFFGLLTACASTPQLTSDQQANITVEVAEYGIYEVDELKEVQNEAYLAGSSLTAEIFELKEQTDKISAKKGTTFGVSFEISGLPDKQKYAFREVMRFPPMTDPDTGKTQSYYESMRELKNGTTKFKGFTLEYDWELVKGEWLYQIYYQDSLLAEKRFILQ